MNMQPLSLEEKLALLNKPTTGTYREPVRHSPHAVVCTTAEQAAAAITAAPARLATRLALTTHEGDVYTYNYLRQVRTTERVFDLVEQPWNGTEPRQIDLDDLIWRWTQSQLARFPLTVDGYSY